MTHLKDMVISRRRTIGLLLATGTLPPLLGAWPAAAGPGRNWGRAPRQSSLLTDPLRRIAKPGLAFEQVAQLTGTRHRVTFHQATWDGGQTYVRDLEVKTAAGTWLRVTDPDRRFDEQWGIYSGPFLGHPNAEPRWVAFSALRQLGRDSVELQVSDPELCDLTVRWSVVDSRVEIQYQITAAKDGDHVVSYQGFDLTDQDGVTEVLCGAQQHSRVIVADPMPRAAWELFAPMTLVERQLEGQAVTVGAYVPAAVLDFYHERTLGSDEQPYGMALRNEDMDVVPVVYEPQPGLRATLAAGESRAFALGVCAEAKTLDTVYRDLAYDEFGLRPYRENVYDTPLTEAIHNMVDLVGIEPDGDDSETLVPSFSGWWGRAKGFVYVETANQVVSATGGALLSAHYLTSRPEDDALYVRRGRPMLEYQLSRRGIGFKPGPGQPTLYHLGGVVDDALSLNSLYQLTKRRNAGIQHDGAETAQEGKVGRDRARFSTALAAAELTGDESYRTEAVVLATEHAREVTEGYTDVPTERSFGFRHSKFWIDLLVMFEQTGDETYLQAARREAARFVTQTMLRPVPDGEVRVGEGHVVMRQYDWPSGALPDYPNTEVTPETVPSWYVSTCGLSFEQLSTYKIGTSVSVDPAGGFVFNPCWAPFLLRLSHHTGEKLFADVAHNMVVGRFTNYPGYYSRQFQTIQMKPRFPLEGPPGVSTIYPHHIPAQIGLAMGYLIGEHYLRSGGMIDFPKVHEAIYVYFVYSLYGHAPGSFYGEDQVWPYFPRGIVDVDNPQINWLTAVGNSSLYVSLVNESAQIQEVTVNVASTITGVGAGQSIMVSRLIDDHLGEPTTSTSSVTVTLPPHGITALAVRGVEINVPWHAAPTTEARDGLSHHRSDIDPGSDSGAVKGVLLVRPDGNGYDAYVAVDTTTPATLRYRTDDGPWQETAAKPDPYEWTIAVADPASTFTYQIRTGDSLSEEVTLRLPTWLSGAASTVAFGEVLAPSSTVNGAQLSVAVRVHNPSDAPISGVSVVLGPPDGWVWSTTTPISNEIPAGGSSEATFALTVPAATEVATFTLDAEVHWSGGVIAVEHGEIVVRDPRRVVDLVPDITELSGPGAVVQFTARAVNPGVLARASTLRLIAPAGWAVDNAEVELTLGAGELIRHSFRVTAPADAAPVVQHRFEAVLDGGQVATAAVTVAVPSTIVHTASGWPHYLELGPWAASGLRGWNGTPTRYSVDGITGGIARWAPDLPTAGRYEVAVWYPTNPDTTTGARFVVRHLHGEDVVVVDQRQHADEWLPLGLFDFAAGSEGCVYVDVANSDIHRTSAARFQPVAGDADPDRLIVSVEAVPSAGSTTPLTVQIRAAADSTVEGCVAIGAPDGWSVSLATINVSLLPGEERELQAMLTAPDSAVSGDQYEVVAVSGSCTARAVVSVGTPSGAGVVLVDNSAGSPNYVEEGLWRGSSLAGHDGGGTRYVTPATSGSATWTAELSTAASVAVAVWLPASDTSSAQASYRITHGGQTSSIPVDQRSSGAWRVIGTWAMDPGQVTVNVGGADRGALRADAVQLIPVHAAEAPQGCQ